MMQVCYVNTEQQPIKTEHICYFTSAFFQDGREKIALKAIVKDYYPHPDAPQDAVVSVIREALVSTYLRHEVRAANAVLLEAAQKACINPQLPIAH